MANKSATAQVGKYSVTGLAPATALHVRFGEAPRKPDQYFKLEDGPETLAFLRLNELDATLNTVPSGNLDLKNEQEKLRYYTAILDYAARRALARGTLVDLIEARGDRLRGLLLKQVRWERDGGGAVHSGRFLFGSFNGTGRRFGHPSLFKPRHVQIEVTLPDSTERFLITFPEVLTASGPSPIRVTPFRTVLFVGLDEITTEMAGHLRGLGAHVIAADQTRVTRKERRIELTDRGVPLLDAGDHSSVLQAFDRAAPLSMIIERYSSDTLLTPEGGIEKASPHEEANRALVEALKGRYQVPVFYKDAPTTREGALLLPLEAACVELLRPLAAPSESPVKAHGAEVTIDAILPTTRPYDEPNRHSTDGPSVKSARSVEARLLRYLQTSAPALLKLFSPVTNPQARSSRAYSFSVETMFGPWTAHTLLKMTVRAQKRNGKFLMAKEYRHALAHQPNVRIVGFDHLSADGEPVLLDDTQIQNIVFNKLGAIHPYKLTVAIAPLHDRAFRVFCLVPQLTSTVRDRLASALLNGGVVSDDQLANTLVDETLDLQRIDERLRATFPPKGERRLPGRLQRLARAPLARVAPPDGLPATLAQRPALAPDHVAQALGKSILRTEGKGEYTRHFLGPDEYLVSHKGVAPLHVREDDGGFTLRTAPAPGLNLKVGEDKKRYVHGLIGFLHSRLSSQGFTVRVFDHHQSGLKRFLTGRHLTFEPDPDLPGRTRAPFSLGNLAGSRWLLGSPRVPESRRLIQLTVYRVDDPAPDPASTTITLGSREDDPILFSPNAALLIFGFGNIAGETGILARQLGFLVTAFNRSPNERALHALEHGITLYEFDEQPGEDERPRALDRQRKEYEAAGVPLGPTVRTLLSDGVVIGETQSRAAVKVRVRAIIDGLFGTLTHPRTGKTLKVSEYYKALLFDQAEAQGIPTIYEGANNPQVVARGKVVSQDFLLNREIEPASVLPRDGSGAFRSVQCVSCNTTNLWSLTLALSNLPFESVGDLDVNVLLLRKMNDQYVGEYRQATGTQGMILFMQPKYVRDLWQFVQSIDEPALKEREQQAFAPILDGFSAQVSHQPGTDLHFGLLSLRRKDGGLLNAELVKRELAHQRNRHLQLLEVEDRVSSMEFLRTLYYRMGFRNLYVHPAMVLQNGRSVLVVFFTPHLHNVKVNSLVFAAMLSGRVPATLEGLKVITELVDRSLRVEDQKKQLARYYPTAMALPPEAERGATPKAETSGPPASYQPIYFLGPEQTESSHLSLEIRRFLLGGKGAGMAEMCTILYEDPLTGSPTPIPVPYGYTITTKQCLRYLENNRLIPKDLREMIHRYQERLESVMGKRLGDPEDPLLVSVRSGARVSMPGMMDTVLNLGLNDRSVIGLARQSGDEEFAWDSYQRFVEMYADVVLGVKRETHLKPIKDRLLASRHRSEELRLPVEDLKTLVKEYQHEVERVTGRPFPQDPRDQLMKAIEAVFRSSFNERAKAFRKFHEIPEDTVSAVNVVSMIFGNRGSTSATGVAFTRDPLTGEKDFNGEYLVNAQGEDVVAGIRTGQKIAHLLEEPDAVLHTAYRQLLAIQGALERTYKAPQDIEFTIEQGTLWILQTRSLDARSGRAALRIVTDMVHEGMLTPEEALLKFGDPEGLNEVLQPIFDPEAERQAEAEGRALAQGIAASVGAACGEVVCSSEAAERLGKAGRKVILVRPETSPDDIEGMQAAQGILTTRGGRTSHAAVVARGMGKAAVVGADAVSIDEEAKCMRIGDRVIHEGEVISLDGSTGKFYLGTLRVVESAVKRKLMGETVDADGEETYGRLMTLLRWANAEKALNIRTNADNAEDTMLAVRLGAEGIGLLRTEHAVLAIEEERLALSALLLAIVVNEKSEIDRALNILFPYLKQDAARVFDALHRSGPEMVKPATIRLFDPVVNEFLPTTEAERVKIAEILGTTPAQVHARTERMREINPMLGNRGVRLVIASPELAAMQARAVFEAAVDLIEAGGKALPEIEIPLVVGTEEVQRVTTLIRQVAHRVMRERNVNFEYGVGVMVETPAGVRTANVYAPYINFISFGMNDLTQTVLAMSRDDSGKFLKLYQEEGIFAVDPFKTIDVQVVGSFVKEATERARSTNPDIYVGAAGDLGGDPVSVGFFHDAGLDGVSASPWLIPISILSAAQANLRNPRRHPS